MSNGLISQDMEFFQTDELVDNLGVGKTSAIDELNSIIASFAFPLDKISILKEKMLTTIENLPVNEASNLSVLSDSLAKASPQDISAILFQSGISPDTFSVETFGLDIESLTNFQSSVMGFNASLNGGCDALLALENLVTDIGNEIDLDNIFQPISDYMEDLAKSVEDVVKSIEEQFEQLADLKFDDIINQIELAAEDVISAIATDVEALVSGAEALALSIQADIESIDLTSFFEGIEAEAKAIADAFESSIEKILEDVQEELIGFKDSIEACLKHNAMVNEVKIKNYQDGVEGLPEAAPEVSIRSLARVQTALNGQLDEAKGVISTENQKFVKAMTAAIVSSTSRNNPNANPDEVRAATARSVSTAQRKRDEETDKVVENAGGKVKQAPKTIADLTTGAAGNVLDSNLGGRPIPKKEVLIGKTAKYIHENSIYPEEFFSKSEFAGGNAKWISGLHPIVRDRVARAVRDLVLENQDVGGKKFDIKIISGVRDSERQRRLRASGNSLAAKDSWHEHGAAIDMNIFIDGVPYLVWKNFKKKEPNYDNIKKYYTGLSREYFARYNMFNRLDGTWGTKLIMDPNHFIPTELWGKSIKSLKSVLYLSSGSINKNGLDRLLAVHEYPE
tara:strand:+ start:616 stop:2481 length:1866 start_codon:yes stop_codon:yes gene_type:complete